MAPNPVPCNLVELFEGSVARHPDNLLFGTKDAAGKYCWETYREIGRRVDCLRAGLAGLGVKAGDAVGIIANNRQEWAIAAFATFGLKARFVPMYEKELAKVWQYIVNDSGVRVLLVSTPEIHRKIDAMKADMPGLSDVLLIDGEGECSMAALERQGAERPVIAQHPSPEETAVLIYTSGTTGRPKGVLLTHGNFTSNVRAGISLFPHIETTSRSLSILPWAHSFGQTAELYTFTHQGAAIGFMQDVTTIGADIEALAPTFLIAVPRVFNRIYDGIRARIRESGGLAEKLFQLGVDTSRKRRDLAARGKTSLATHLKLKLADRLVFSKIRSRFGGRLQCALSGSATMNVEIANFFFDIGIPVYDCYGLTETSPAVSMNCPQAFKLGSVGRPIPGVRVQIDTSMVESGSTDGEIVVHGPNVMRGYHNNPAATAEVTTPDGGFRTGDRGRIDADGYLFITGRLKEQYKLENGKYVFPASLEEEIKLVPFVENAMVYGEGRAFNVCLVVPDFVVLGQYVRDHDLSTDPADLVRSPEVREMIQSAIIEALKGKYGGYEIPKKFIFLEENFSLDNGMLTQTMKLKRRSVLEKFQGDIESAYQQ